MKQGKFLRYCSIVLGTCILAFGLYNIHSRSGISEGGVLGLTLLIYHWFGISPGFSSFVLDMTCFSLGTLVMGRGFLGDSVLASALYAVWYRLFEHFGPVLPNLTDAPLLAAVLGGLFVGLGCGLVVRQDCAAGGDDALVLSVNKLTGIRVSLVYMLSDFIVLMLSLSYIPLRRIIWSMGTTLLSSAVIELLRKREKNNRLQENRL